MIYPTSDYVPFGAGLYRVAVPSGSHRWMDLTGFNLEFDPGTAESIPTAKSGLDAYAEAIANLSGADAVRIAAVGAYRLSPSDVADEQTAIIGLLTDLVNSSIPGVHDRSTGADRKREVGPLRHVFMPSLHSLK